MNILANFIINALKSVDDRTKADFYNSLRASYQYQTYKSFRKKYQISSDFRFNGNDILFYGEGKIICGENSYIGNHSSIQSFKECIVSIGNNCSISHNVRMYTCSNIADQDLNHGGEKQKKTGNIIINDGVWIGANVFINPDVTIGQNAIIGANSVVTKDVEPFSIYGGVPAKLIKQKNSSPE